MEHSAAGTWVWNVPAGQRVIVKYFSVVSFQSVISVAQVIVNGFAVWHRQFPAGGGAVQADMMAVGYGGEQVKMYLSHADMVGHLSGWVLADPDNRSGPPASASTLPSPEPDPFWSELPEGSPGAGEF